MENPTFNSLFLGGILFPYLFFPSLQSRFATYEGRTTTEQAAAPIREESKSEKPVRVGVSILSEDSPDPLDEPSPGAPSRRRIVDRRMVPGTAEKLARVPLYPLIGLGKGLEKGLLVVEGGQQQQRLRKWQLWLQQHHLQLLNGGMGTGSGFGFGLLIFDNNFLGRRIRLEVPLQHSTRNYQEVGALLNFGLLPHRRAFLELSTQYRSRPREDFFGLGETSLETQRTKYMLQDRNVGAAIGTKFGENGRLDFGIRYTNTNIFTRNGRRFPSTEQVFPDLPGLSDGSSLLRYGFTATHSRLDNAFDPRKGYELRARFQWVDSLNSNHFDFYDYGLVADGYVPLGGPRRTLAVRLAADLRQERNGGEIPFYLLPVLGGAETMRGFRPFRFRDANALVLSVEYRYEISQFGDFVIFTDQGQVARAPGDFSFGRFRPSYGVGMRIRNLTGVVMRFDVARSSEGTRAVFSFSPEF